MNANEINAKLRSMYQSHIRSFDKKKYDIRNYTNPILMQCSDEYADEDNIRVLYIGLNAPEWFPGIDTYNTRNGYDLRKALPLYKRPYVFGDKVFFELISSINSSLNGERRNNYLWTDVYKFNPRNNKCLKPLVPTPDWKELNFDIIEHEIKCSKPDMVFFVTGDLNDKQSKDLEMIEKIFGDGTAYIPVEECPDVMAIRSFKRKFAAPMFRIPMVSKRNYSLYENVVTTSTILVLNSNIKFYGKLKRYKTNQLQNS